MGALLVNLGRESGSHDAPLLFSVSYTSQGSPAGIATTLRDPPPIDRSHVQTACRASFLSDRGLRGIVNQARTEEDDLP